MKTTTVSGPRSDENCTSPPLVSRKAKSSTLEPSLNSCPSNTATESAAAIKYRPMSPPNRAAPGPPLLLLVQLQIPHHLLVRHEDVDLLGVAGGPLIIGLQLVFHVRTQPVKRVGAVLLGVAGGPLIIGLQL